MGEKFKQHWIFSYYTSLITQTDCQGSEITAINLNQMTLIVTLTRTIKNSIEQHRTVPEKKRNWFLNEFCGRAANSAYRAGLGSSYVKSGRQYCGSGMFIPDPNFSIPDLGSRVKKIPDSGSASNK
jgi:hypothetical protein